MRLALAIEGGGMRGVVSAGMVAALESHGYGPDLFDAVYGSSGGSINGAYFLAGQARFGTSIYFEDIVRKEFIDLWRFLRGKPVLSLAFLIEKVMDDVKPLDYERTLASQKLRPIATRVSSADRFVFPAAKTKAELQKQLRASASIPVVAGPPGECSGDRFLDASLTEAIPWQAPIEQGYDAVLVLSTRPLGVGRSHGIGARAATRVLSWFMPHSVRHLAVGRAATSVRRAQELEQAATDGTWRGVRADGSEAMVTVAAVCPDGDATLPSQLCQEPATLIDGAKGGFHAVERFLGVPESQRFLTAGALERDD